ncbi:Cellulose binding domain-containing protein [Micromonospora viridifaciens]|uniref:Cellulose binding domain-containing protein n=1 Tax=Micromonospora viridifaciens TaxID=1881 RepID=A0A1C4ZY77_MICVI|nr:cellulose binding domain-containing protein [Micromonospora viridifaciens]SCF37952.1 Cellulose binding domain-containing protein [Micromonospora viridifaciens]
MIILLDGLVVGARAVRRALAGRGDGSRLAHVAIAASLGVLLATAYSIVAVLRTPERLTPVAVKPAPDAAAISVLTTGTPGEQSPPTTRTPTPASTGGRPTTPSAVPPPGAAPSVAVPPTTTAPTRTPLRANFVVEENALLSYGAAVTIANPGPTEVTDWVLVIVLPRKSLEVTSVKGAQASRDGAVWTFVPQGSTGTVPGHGSVRVTFRVNGAAISATPTGCTIDEAACTGLPA